MLIFYTSALLNGGSVSESKRMLKAEEDTRHNAVINKIEEDFTIAQTFETALKLPANSEAHKLAKAFLEDLRKQSATEQERRFLDHMAKDAHDKAIVEAMKEAKFAQELEELKKQAEKERR